MKITNPEGYHDGTISDARVEMEKGNLVMYFDVDIEGFKTTTCRHGCGGQYGYIAKDVAEHLELQWPEGLKKIETVLGRAVRVKVKHKDTWENSSIVTRSRNQDDGEVTDEVLDAAIAKLAAEENSDDDTPF